MKRNPASWLAENQDLITKIAVALLVVIGGANLTGDSPPELEARVLRNERRLDEIEEWREIDLAFKRFSLCRFDQEDEADDPRECRVLLRRYEEQLLPPTGGQ